MVQESGNNDLIVSINTQKDQMSVTQGNPDTNYQPFSMSQTDQPRPLHELEPDVMKIEELQNNDD